MMRTSTPTLIIPGFFILLAFSTSVMGGTCSGPGPACYEYWKTDIVFIGVVTDISHPEIAEAESWAPASIAKFSVEESFRGVNEKEIEIASSIRRAGSVGFSTDGMGYHEFEMGTRFLVYAYRSKTDRWIWSSLCSRTRPLADAREDLKYIRGLASAKSGSTIQGTVWRRGEWIEDDQSGPIRGIRVIAQAGGKRFEAVTNSLGEYRIERLKLGTYKVSFLIPPHFVVLWDRNQKYREVSLTQDQGCVEANFQMAADGGISGKVRDSNGRLVPGVNVEIVAAGLPRDEQYGKSWVSRTDENGRYEIRPVPPGLYHLGINIAGDHWGVGYDRSYYPGVTGEKDAMVIDIAEGLRRKDFDFTVPSVSAYRTIRGEIRLAPMKPVAGALIALESSEDGKPRWDLAVETDEQGRFSITEHDSYIVWVHAKFIGSDGKPMHAEPVRLEKRIGEITPFLMENIAAGANCNHYRAGK